MAGNFWQSSHCAQWLLDRADILRERQSDFAHLLGQKSGPSAPDHMLPALKPDQLTTAGQDYQKIMIFFANLIQTLGEQLKLRQQVIATATVYFKRFYAQNSLRSIDPLLLAPTSVFLASKIEEFGVISNTRLINTCSSVIKNKFAYAFPGQDFPYRANHILECEFFLLENMDCSLVIFQPYRPLIHFVQDIVSGGYLTDEQCTVHLLPDAWRLLNDSLRTDASLMYPPYQIAVAVLYIASAIVFADKTEVSSIRQWFLELHVSLEVVKDISRMLIGLYEMWRTFDLKKDMAGILERMPKPQINAPN